MGVETAAVETVVVVPEIEAVGVADKVVVI